MSDREDLVVHLDTPDGESRPVVVVVGEVDLFSSGLLAERLAEVVQKAPESVVIDLTGTTFMDCGGARPIALARELLAAEECQVYLRHPRPVVRKVLEVMGLDGSCIIEP
jgi:anti-sigma B factor antagonist